MYGYLVSGTNVVLRWFCKNCEKLIISKQDTAACHSDHLIIIIKKLMERYEKFDNQLENKTVRQRSF